MILQALNDHYQRLLARNEPGLSALGYSPEKISYEVLLGSNGKLVGINNIQDQSGKKPVPRMLNVPQPEKRTVGIKSNFLWDKSSYVFGVSASSKRADKEHEAFRALHQAALANASDVGLRAFLSFLNQWSPEFFSQSPFEEDMRDANFVFRMDGELLYLHERPAAQAVRARLLQSDPERAAADSICLVTGERASPARLHPSIKGVNGAQTAGASIVSFNLDAFSSYQKSQGENAPVSEHAAFAYTTVLNHLLRRSEHNRQRLQIGDASVVFWAEADQPSQAKAAEWAFENMLNPPPEDGQEAEKVRHVLEGVVRGRPLKDIDPALDERTRMFILGLAPNASRLSIRFWECDTLGQFARRLSDHAADMEIKPLPWRTAPAARRLVLATVPYREGSMPKADDASPHLIGELMRAILSGRRYPPSLLANTIMRMRADGHLSGMRVALCKGVLARDRRLGVKRGNKEEVPVGLDVKSLNPGYRLGRLFAVLENIQHQALGGKVNATIRDRYYGAASATPASVFPVLLRNAQNHMGRLRKDKPGLAVNLEKEIRSIVDGLEECLPRSLRIEDQGRFAIGYYHQAHSRFNKDGQAQEAVAVDSDNQEGDPA